MRGSGSIRSRIGYAFIAVGAAMALVAVLNGVARGVGFFPPVLIPGIIVCLVGVAFQGRRALGWALVGLGLVCGCLSWLVWVITEASEAYPPAPLWPAYLILGIAVACLLAGPLVLLLGKRSSDPHLGDEDAAGPGA